MTKKDYFKELYETKKLLLNAHVKERKMLDSLIAFGNEKDDVLRNIRELVQDITDMEVDLRRKAKK